MNEHADHAEKTHTLAAVIMVLIIVGLITWLLSFADSWSSAFLTVPFTLGVGLYAVFGLARGRTDEH